MTITAPCQPVSQRTEIEKNCLLGKLFTYCRLFCDKKRETLRFRTLWCFCYSTHLQLFGSVILVTHKKNTTLLEIAIRLGEFCNYFRPFCHQLEIFLALTTGRYYCHLANYCHSLVKFCHKEDSIEFIEHFGYTNWLIVEAPRLVLAPTVP